MFFRPKPNIKVNEPSKVLPFNLQFFAPEQETTESPAAIEPDQTPEPTQQPETSPQSQESSSLTEASKRMLERLMKQDATPSEPSTTDGPQTKPDVVDPAPTDKPGDKDPVSVKDIMSKIKDLNKPISTLKTDQAQTDEPNQEELIHGLTKDQFAKIAEGLQEGIYDNPQEVLKTLLDTATQSMMSQIKDMTGQVSEVNKFIEQQKRSERVHTAIETVAKKLPDFEERSTEVAQAIMTLKDLGVETDSLADNPEFLELAYQLSFAFEQSKYKPFEEYLQDETYLEKAATNDAIRQRVLKEAADAIKKNQPPYIPGAKSPVVPSSAPNPDVNTIKAASKRFFDRLNE